MAENGAIGDGADAATLERAVVKPETCAMSSDGHELESACLNCATPLIGDHCHACGQRGHVHRTLKGFFHDLLHGVFHFEGKIWRTLPLLAWRPGQLTCEYAEGKRARFVSPLALFLFSVFLMFAVASAFGGAIVVGAGDGREGGVYLGPGVEDEGFEAIGFETGVPRIDAAIRRANENPSLTIYKVQNNAYKYSWALIPVSLPFMWLLFPFNRRFRLYDHIVFITYSLSFMTLLVSIAIVLGVAGLGAVAGMMMILPPIHMYRQLKGAYGLTSIGALWRTVLLIVFAVTAVSVFVSTLLALGIF